MRPLASGYFWSLLVLLAPQSPVDALQDASEPEPGDLLGAIQRGSEAAALSLLQRPRLPGLNEVDELGQTVLHQAIVCRLPEVALAILARTDFQAVNAQEDDDGETALHWAALQGFLPVCRAIVGQANFTELRAVDLDGDTALQWARIYGLGEVAEFLEVAEASRA